MKRFSTVFLSICVSIILLTNCQSKEQYHENIEVDKAKSVHFDLDSIMARGYLIAIVDNSLSSMFLYRGEPMGFEYELISQFTQSIGIELRFVVTKSLEEGFEMLNDGRGDVLAYNLTVTQERRKIMDFTDPQHYVSQVLVQRKPKNWRNMKLHEIDKELIKNPIDLDGKTIHVRSSSAYAARLQNLAEEIGGEITVIEEEDMETEEIIELVAEGKIDYTVADDNIAKVHARFYPILNVRTPVSLRQQIAWGVRIDSDQLRNKINEWQGEMKKTAAYNELYNKYYRNRAANREFIMSEFLTKDSNSLSPYDSLLKSYAETIDWDWRLLAALVSKESRFDPDIKSWMGAIGLMQVMPRTGRAYKIENLYDPESNITAGTLHIQWLKERWTHIEDSVEQIKFVLGSYNVGQGHVQDAVRLTEKYGGDSHVWDDNVAKYLELKSKEKYFEDPVVQFGFCRGDEPVEYVVDILNRYDRYLQMDNSFID